MSINEYQQPLIVEDFNQGIDAYDSDIDPPKISTWSYDKGWAFASRVPPCCRHERAYKIFSMTGKCFH